MKRVTAEKRSFREDSPSIRSGELAKPDSDQISLVRNGLEPFGPENGNPAEAYQMLGRRRRDKVPIPNWSTA